MGSNETNGTDGTNDRNAGVVHGEDGGSVLISERQRIDRKFLKRGPVCQNFPQRTGPVSKRDVTYGSVGKIVGFQNQ